MLARIEEASEPMSGVRICGGIYSSTNGTTIHYREHNPYTRTANVTQVMFL